MTVINLVRSFVVSGFLNEKFRVWCAYVCHRIENSKITKPIFKITIGSEIDLKKARL